jgi:hypothetical protein
MEQMGLTSLFMASMNGHHNVVKLLLESKASVDSAAPVQIILAHALPTCLHSVVSFVLSAQAESLPVCTPSNEPLPPSPILLFSEFLRSDSWTYLSYSFLCVLLSMPAMLPPSILCTDQQLSSTPLSFSSFLYSVTQSPHPGPRLPAASRRTEQRA